MEAVVASVEFEIPEAMVEREIQFQINRFSQQLQMQGISLEQYFEMTGQDMEKMRESIRESALRNIKTDLVLDKIAEIEGIKATDEETEVELERTAAMYGMGKEELVAQLKKVKNYDRFMEDIKYQIVNRKTRESLV